MNRAERIGRDLAREYGVSYEANRKPIEASLMFKAEMARATLIGFGRALHEATRGRRS